LKQIITGKATSTKIGSIDFFIRFFYGMGLIAEVNPEDLSGHAVFHFPSRPMGVHK
jgi:hypothetical protein